MGRGAWLVGTPYTVGEDGEYQRMPDYPNIDRYYSDLAELIELGGSDNELNIRPAFQNCLAAYCAAHREKLVLVPELASSRGNKPDGTIRDALRMARGYWEAKDPHDNLDAEIQAKFSQGYPTDNILFEASREAVLFQNGAEAMRVEMTDASKLHRLIDSFLNYELPEIEEFRQAQQQFKADLPSVLDNLRQEVAEAEEGNAAYREGVVKFLELCHRSIGPGVTDSDVREMLLQHILTQDIFCGCSARRSSTARTASRASFPGWSALSLPATCAARQSAVCGPTMGP